MVIGDDLNIGFFCGQDRIPFSEGDGGGCGICANRFPDPLSSANIANVIHAFRVVFRLPVHHGIEGLDFRVGRVRRLKEWVVSILQPDPDVETCPHDIALMSQYPLATKILISD